MKEIPFGFRTEKEFSALEKILKAGETHFKLDKLRSIIEAYEDYDGDASRASQELHCVYRTILKHWEKAELPIKRGDKIRVDIKKIRDAYVTYDGNAKKASEDVGNAPSTIIKYWRAFGFEIRKRGLENGKIIDQKKHEKYKRLIELGYSQTKIASELGISKLAVSAYIIYRGLPKPKRNGRPST